MVVAIGTASGRTGTWRTQQRTFVTCRLVLHRKQSSPRTGPSDRARRVLSHEQVSVVWADRPDPCARCHRRSLAWQAAQRARPSKARAPHLHRPAALRLERDRSSWRGTRCRPRSRQACPTTPDARR
jgi:hypothetical protein